MEHSWAHSDTNAHILQALWAFFGSLSVHIYFHTPNLVLQRFAWGEAVDDRSTGALLSCFERIDGRSRGGWRWVSWSLIHKKPFTQKTPQWIELRDFHVNLRTPRRRSFDTWKIVLFFFPLRGARFTYERSYIEGCLKSKKLSPMTGKNIETQVLGSNYRKWFCAARSFWHEKFTTAKSPSSIFPQKHVGVAPLQTPSQRCR